MDRELAQVSRRIRTLSIRLKFIDMRRSARWVLDRFQFGSEVGLRLAAALVLAALFFLLLLGVASATQMPTQTGLILGGLALASAAVTSAVFVLGPSDSDLTKQRTAVVEGLQGERVHAAELRAEIAEEKAERDYRDAEREERRRRTCPYCGGRIKPWAMKCPHCHEYLDEDLAREREESMQPKPNTGLAAVLSFLIPGLGQIYKRQVLAGLLWLFVVEGTYILGLLTVGCCVGFAVIPLAILLHLICIFDAASGG